MHYEPTDTAAMARTSNLNEELGQVNGISRLCVDMEVRFFVIQKCRRQPLMFVAITSYELTVPNFLLLE